MSEQKRGPEAEPAVDAETAAEAENAAKSEAETAPEDPETSKTDADGDGGDVAGHSAEDEAADSDEDEGAAEEEADETAQLEEKYARLSDQYVRLAADFDNFRRRTRENEAAVREQAAANLIKDLLPVIDNLQLALAKTEAAEDDGFVQGVLLIEQQLTSVLQNHGLRPVPTVGEPFDPHTMEAVAQLDGAGQAEPGHVMEELRRGYLLHDKVLRPAQVVVAKAD